MHKIQIPPNWLYLYRYKDSDTNFLIGFKPKIFTMLEKNEFSHHDYDLILQFHKTGELTLNTTPNEHLAFVAFNEAERAIRFKFAFGELIAADLLDKTCV
jgi:hypothetical protein